MSSRAGTASAVAKLYTAAGRNYAETELAVYHDALSDMSDEELDDAVRLIIRKVDLGTRPPSPNLLREHVMVVRSRRPQPLAVEESTGPALEKDEAAEYLAAARAALRGQR